MAAPKTGTRERLLDAAEALFATKGYEGASTRDIVGKSGDTIGSVNYHFGSKEKLFVEVVMRRWDDVLNARRDAYRKSCEQADPPPLDKVIDAIVTPFLERAMRGGKGWRNYIQILAQMYSSEKPYYRELRRMSEDTAREFIGWVEKALPDADLRTIGFAYHFMIAVMVETAAEASVNRIKRITGGAADTSDFDAVRESLLKFICGGMLHMTAGEVAEAK